MPGPIDVSLSDEDAAFVRSKVASGEYVSVEAVVSAALSALTGQEEPSWLPPPDVLKRLIDEALDDPSPNLTPEEVRESLLEHHEAYIVRNRNRGAL